MRVSRRISARTIGGNLRPTVNNSNRRSTLISNSSGNSSTAIRFNEDASGAYFQLDDGKYFCCDPTYIGADVGESMPDYAGKSAKIIRL